MMKSWCLECSVSTAGADSGLAGESDGGRSTDGRSLWYLAIKCSEVNDDFSKVAGGWTVG